MSKIASTVNSHLSPQIQVKPVVGNVTYYVKGAGVPLPGVVDEGGNKKIARPSISLPGEYFITDPGSGNKSVKVQVIHALEHKSIRLENGAVQLIPIQKRVDIEGIITINAETNFETYAFLERSPYNGSNKFRDKTQPVKFFKKDAKKAKIDGAKQRQRTDTAIYIIRDSDKESITNIATHINKVYTPKINIDQEIMFVRDDIRKLAETKPELIIMGSTNLLEKKKIQAQMWEELGLLDFDDVVTRDWTYKEDVLAHADVGEDRYDVIAQALEDPENKKVYNKIGTEYKKLKS